MYEMIQGKKEIHYPNNLEQNLSTVSEIVYIVVNRIWMQYYKDSGVDQYLFLQRNCYTETLYHENSNYNMLIVSTSQSIIAFMK